MFSQRTDRGGVLIDIDGWNAHAVRFFSCRVGLTSDPPRSPTMPLRATFVVAPDRGAAGLRTVVVRPVERDDLAAAEAADARVGDTGLARLARRCPVVWLVARDAEHDALALRLAAILASILLGPILDVRRAELFGVKTARAKLDSLSG